MLDRVSHGSLTLRRAALACLVSTLTTGLSSPSVRADQAPMALSSPTNASLKFRSARQSWHPGESVPLTHSLRIVPAEAETEKVTQDNEPTPEDESQPKTVAAESLKLRPISTTEAPKGLGLKPLSARPAAAGGENGPVPRAEPAPSQAPPRQVARPKISDSEPPKFNPPPQAVTPLSPAKTVSTPTTMAGRTGKPSGPSVRSSTAPVERLSPAVESLRSSATPSMDLKQSNVDDGWVAREAINQIAPLTDPATDVATKPRLTKSELTVPPKSPTDGSNDNHSPSDRATSNSMLLAPANVAKAKTAPVATNERPVEMDRGSSSNGEPSQQRTSETNRVQVRSLKITRDGAVAGQPRSAPALESAAARRSISDLNSGARDSLDSLPDRMASRSRRDSEPTVKPTSPLDDLTEPAVDRDVELDFTGRPRKSIVVNRNVARLRTPIRQVLQYFYNRPEIADGRSNWGMMHAIMVYGTDTKVQVGRQRHSTIAWIAGNNVCRGKRLLVDGPDGIEADNGVGLQGHQGQFLMTLALAGVPEDYPLYANGKKYSVKQLVDREAETCRSGEELTFSLIGLSHYLSTDDTWTTEDGEHWDFERLIAEELSQPIIGAACGGTHRLMGFAHALRNRRREGLPIDGQWLRAENFLQDFVAYTYRMQNRDGSFSTSWFEEREYRDDTDRKIQTTGHMVEWLLTNTPEDELQNPRLVAAIQFLATTMRSDLDHDWSIGPKGHALRSLRLYYDRVFDDGPAWANPTVRPAQRSASIRQSRSRR